MLPSAVSQYVFERKLERRLRSALTPDLLESINEGRTRSDYTEEDIVDRLRDLPHLTQLVVHNYLLANEIENAVKYLIHHATESDRPQAGDETDED